MTLNFESLCRKTKTSCNNLLAKPLCLSGQHALPALLWNQPSCPSPLNTDFYSIASIPFSGKECLHCVWQILFLSCSCHMASLKPPFFSVPLLKKVSDFRKPGTSFVLYSAWSPQKQGNRTLPIWWRLRQGLVFQERFLPQKRYVPQNNKKSKYHAVGMTLWAWLILQFSLLSVLRQVLCACPVLFQRVGEGSFSALWETFFSPFSL